MKRLLPRALTMRQCAAGGILLATAFLGYREIIVPIQVQERLALGRIAELRDQICGARDATKAIQALEQETGRAQIEMHKLHDGLPASAPVVWFPGRMGEHFRRFGMNDAVTRLNTTTERPDLPGYAQTYWAIDLPLRDGPGEVGRMLLATAELEEAERFVRVIDVAVSPRCEALLGRRGVVTVEVLARDGH